MGEEYASQQTHYVTIPTHYKFEEKGVIRRAALGLLSLVEDPEIDKPMMLSSLKSSRKYKFLEDNCVTLEGGYRLCRSTRYFPVDSNKYYWEFDFIPSPELDSHVRFGIATVKADMETPVGFDSEGYSVRDLGGAFHKRHKTGSPPFPPNSTVGFGIFSNENGFVLQMFINGFDQGIIFENIDLEKHWIPSLSIYKSATVRARFSRPFKFDPGLDWKDAIQVPKPITNCQITADELIYVMHHALPGNEKQKILYTACSQALTPEYEMPI
ncbi:SPRY domain containing protein [Histomonas meleagridis]|uniref:SPRY domain containing protein n=1 Tax=Histomonas meleagridis TaxID=135588 RepID=UPI003559489C|nr:SPRY domain containing protein [Histomonas meleagridis]KAH0801070.1 SPRY domain containing protein [Histomonas meleagridis]